MSILDRAIDVYRATMPRAPWDGLAHPFGTAPRRPHAWRVSWDVWDELVLELRRTYPATPLAGGRLIGEPIRIDETLPPNSMLLEPVDWLPAKGFERTGTTNGDYTRPPEPSD